MSLVTTLTHVLPHRLLSSLARRLAYSDNARLKQWLIDTVTAKLGVDLSEAANPDATAYPPFNAFFTRALESAVRVADPDPRAVLMPAAGRISQCGPIDGGRIFQATAQQFTTAALLGAAAASQPFPTGLLATANRSPKDHP